MPRNDSEMAADSFRAASNGRGRDGFRLTGGLAKPNAVLEQIWNTLLRSPSQELFYQQRRRQPVKPECKAVQGFLALAGCHCREVM